MPLLNKMDSDRTILRNLEQHFNVSSPDAWDKLAAIPQYLLEDQMILASAHLFVKNIASIYMRWLFLQPLSDQDQEGHQAVGSFAPFMKVRGLSVDEVLTMWKQESKAALEWANADPERGTRMKLRINTLRREIESEYFKWHNAAKSPEAFCIGRPGNQGMANKRCTVREHRDLRAAGSYQEPEVKGSRFQVLRMMRLRTIWQTLKGPVVKGLRHLKKHNNGEDPEREQPETQDDSVKTLADSLETQDNSAETQDDSMAESSAKLLEEVIDLINPTPSPVSESQTSTPIPHPNRWCRLFKRSPISHQFVQKSCGRKRLAGRIRVFG